MTFKTITVATDLSHRSDRAVRRASALAAAHGAKLTVLHVVDSDLPEEMEAVVLEKGRGSVTSLLEEIGVDPAETEIACPSGDPMEEMIRACLAEPDLFVVGMHRPRPFLDSLRETTAQKTVRHASCPVLMVHEQPGQPYQSVICATDFSPASKVAAEAVAALAPEAELHAVTAIQVPYAGRMSRTPEAAGTLEAAFRRDTEARAVSWRESLTLPAERCGEVAIEIGSALAAIRKSVAIHDATLVSVGAHGRAGALPALLGSVATDLMRDPPCDLLIAR